MGLLCYSHLHNSVNTENSFFGRDVTYLPQKDIFPRPDNADGSALDKDILHYILTIGPSEATHSRWLGILKGG